MPTTIRDVAKKAGVAPITVSRVINNSGYISDKTRKRVEDAIQELQYVPNSLSKSLRFRKTNTIALVLSDITNTFWTTVTRGVEDACSKQGMNVFLCNTDEQEAKLDGYIDALLQRQTDGFILVPAADRPKPIERIKKQDVPLVVIDRPIHDVAVDVVRSDSEGGAYRIVEYLIQKGHHRIVMISGPAQIPTSIMRKAGYIQALHAHGIPVDESLIYQGQYNLQGGYNQIITHQILREISPQPTAIFAGNNFIALGVMRALHEAGLHVPDDISVVSFDDVPHWYPEPFLTVIAQEPYKLGYEAADLLLSLISGETESGNRDIVLPVHLIERASCKDLNHQPQ